jgi:hypothetical protein
VFAAGGGRLHLAGTPGSLMAVLLLTMDIARRF